MSRRFAANLLTLALLGWFVGCRTASPDAHWQSLFNGRDLSGWTLKCKPEDRDKAYWKVEEGVIVADSMEGAKHDYLWLVSDREYSDFVLRLKFQAFRGNPGNSGVQIRSRYDDAAGWLDGPQVDIHPPGPWRTGMIWDETRGVQHWLFPSVPRGKWVDPTMAAPGLKFFYSDDPTPWNELEISVTGTRVKAILNGVTVTDYDGAGVLDDATHRTRQVGERGHLALQIHTGDRLRIRFKEVRIREPGW
jgi:hypothetical protein